MPYRIVILLCLVCLYSSCSPVREARRMVAVADSLRVNEGVTCDDSLALAKAYETFGRWRLIYPNDRARACYYYGRMLRQRGDQVGAMQAFISGSHAPYVQRVLPLPWFNDYHILGRIYSNMGSMCHLVDEFELSYDMYERSADAFQKSGDTTAFYYALNAQALQLAELKSHDKTLSLLHRIEIECADQNVLTKTWETKAILYQNIGLYDSAIYSVKQLYSGYYNYATGYVTAAQCFWCMQQYDSALYYAQQVLEHPKVAAQDKYHMLYLLINHDSIVDKKEVQILSSERADLDCEVIEPLLQQLSAAAMLLQQNLYKKSDYFKLGLYVAAIVLICSITWWATKKIKHHSKQLYEAIISEQQKQNDLIQQHTKLEIQNEKIRIEQNARREKLIQEIEYYCKVISTSSDWREELRWRDYYAFCETANRYFLLLPSKLKTTHNLDEKEIRLCILVLLNNFSNKQLAKNLNYSESGIGTFKYRISQKLNIQSKDLRKYLLEMAVSGTTFSDTNENVQ